MPHFGARSVERLLSAQLLVNDGPFSGIAANIELVNTSHHPGSGFKSVLH